MRCSCEMSHSAGREVCPFTGLHEENPQRPSSRLVPRRHADADGECMECGAALDPLAVACEACGVCGSDQVRIYAEEDENR